MSPITPTGAPPDLRALLDSTSQQTAILRPLLADVLDATREVRDILRALQPKQPEYLPVTLDLNQWWRANHRGFLHLRMLSPDAIVLSVDAHLGQRIAFTLPANVVTEFFLPDESEILIASGGKGPNGQEVVLMIWDDVS